MIRKLFAVVFVLAATSVASAQDNLKVTLEPTVERTTYTRTYLSDAATGISDSGSETNLVENGITATSKVGKYGVKAHFGVGKLGSPTLFVDYSDGLYDTRPYDDATNTVSKFSGTSVSISAMFTYDINKYVQVEAGHQYRHLATSSVTDFTNIATYNHAESDFTDSMFGPRVGVSTHYGIWRLAGNATVGYSPWLHYRQTYQFRLRGTDDVNYRGTTDATKSYDLDFNGSYEAIRGKLQVIGGWRYNEIRTKDADFMLHNPYSDKPTPQRDSWGGVYFGVRIIR